jgi:DNA polymerase I-like protein with 3'-5' exonuclease and polymerase domains
MDVKKIINTLEEYYKFENEFNWKVYSIDTETTSLEYDKLELEGVSLSDGSITVYIPYNKEIIIELKNNMNKLKNSILIMHNSVFDMMTLSKYDFKFDHYELFDTMIAHHLIDENSKHGLKQLAKEYLGVETLSYEDAKKASHETFIEYAMNDALWTFQLALIFKEKLKELDLEYLFRKIEMPFQKVLLQMKIEGVVVNQELLQEYTIKLNEEIPKLESELYEILGVKYEVQHTLTGGISIKGPYNFSSSKQLASILFDKLGLEIVETTDKGQAKTGKITIDKYKKIVPFVEALERYKIASKLYSGFILPLKDYIQKDGKVRTQFLDHGTKTGRVAARSINVQQLPSPKDYSPVNVRSLFTAPKGYKMMSCDYSGQEVFTMAHISKDKNLIKMLRLGQDQHLVNANAVFKLNIPEEKLVKSHPEFEDIKKQYKKERNGGKIFSFGVPYGMGEHKTSRDFNVSEEEAKQMIANLFESFPQLKESIDNTHKEVATNGFVTTLVGRRRNFGNDLSFGELQKAYRQSFNFKIQGLCIPETNKVYDKELGYVEIGSLTGVRTLWDGESWSTGEVVKTGKKKRVDVLLRNGQVLSCSEDHKIRVINPKGEEHWKTPSEFSKQQYVKLTNEISHTLKYVKLPKYEGKVYKLQPWNKESTTHNLKELTFEDITNSFDRGLVIGRLGSEGYYTKKGQLGWLVAEHEEEILPELLRILKPFNPKLKDTTKPGFKRMTTIKISSKSLAFQLEYLDIKNRVHNYFTQNKDLLRGYLKGFFDGDGGVTGEAVVLTFGKRHNNTSLAKEIQEGLQLLGVRSRINYYDTSVRLRIRSSDMQQFSRKIGFINSKKQNKIPLSNRNNIIINRNYRVEKVVYSDEEVEMVDFVNSTTGKFMTDGVVVHNCADMIRAASLVVYEKAKAHPEWGLKAVMTIHDEVDYIVREKYVEEASEFVKKWFEFVTRKFIVPLNAEVEIGDNYGNSK